MAVDLPFAPADPPSVVAAVALNAPTTPADSLFVRITSMAPGDRVEAYSWEPHVAVRAGVPVLTFPSAGTDCLVAHDEDGAPWVVSWRGGWT